jgi:hypothetical protein
LLIEGKAFKTLIPTWNELHKVKPHANVLGTGVCSANVHWVTVHMTAESGGGAKVHLCLTNPF